MKGYLRGIKLSHIYIVYVQVSGSKDQYVRVTWFHICIVVVARYQLSTGTLFATTTPALYTNIISTFPLEVFLCVILSATTRLEQEGSYNLLVHLTILKIFKKGYEQ